MLLTAADMIPMPIVLRLASMYIGKKLKRGIYDSVRADITNIFVKNRELNPVLRKCGFSYFVGNWRMPRAKSTLRISAIVFAQLPASAEK
jgi:hypothetical protein